MTRVIPEDSPRSSTPSEREVWERCATSRPRRHPPGQHPADRSGQGPRGGPRRADAGGGASWCSRSRVARLARRGRLVDQTRRARRRDATRSTRRATRSTPCARYVEHDPRWGGRGHVAWAHGVVTPHSEFGNDFSVPELPRWALHDQRRPGRPRRAGARQRLGAAPTTTRRPTTTTSSSSSRSSPGATHTSYDVNAEAAERARRPPTG